MNHKITSLEEYHAVYRKSVDDPQGFWAHIADSFQWHKKWNKVLEWNFKQPDVKWFINGKLNITENCLDRHLEKFGDKEAIIWEPNDPDQNNQVLTYNQLHKLVCKFANVLKNAGV